MGLGDIVEKALETVGVTKERVEKFLGRPCGCGERKRRLNQLSAWASRIINGKTEDAEKHLESILDQPDPPKQETLSRTELRRRRR